MKLKEKQTAIQLRRNGMSMGEIAERLGVAKSSVSNWVKDIKLNKKFRSKLNKNSHSVDAIEKRRISRIANTRKRREKIMCEAAAMVPVLLQDPLWCVGVSLYWGEGGKTQQTARLSNSDPAVIEIMMRFFQKYSDVSPEKFRGHVHTFSHQNAQRAVTYWSRVSGIPKEKFFKTYMKQSSASKDKRHTLPYGTVQIYIHDTTFFFKLMGWIQGIKSVR